MESPLPIWPPDKYCDDVDEEWSEWASRAFVLACRFGCGDCIQIFLDHSIEKDLDLTYEFKYTPDEHEWDSCVTAAWKNDLAKSERAHKQREIRVLPVLLRFMARMDMEVVDRKNLCAFLKNENPYYYNQGENSLDDELLNLLGIKTKRSYSHKCK